ncbi:MAG: hypothetical protein ACRD3W_31065, partial [Terriglobales bacterium]
CARRPPSFKLSEEVVLVNGNETQPESGCGHRHLTAAGAFWSLPCTLVGFVFALLSGALPHRNDGILVAHSTRGLAHLALAKRGFVAITLGRIVVTVVPFTAALRMHEEHHVWQYGRLGPLFFPAYLYRHFTCGYGDNPFERDAERCAQLFTGRQ